MMRQIKKRNIMTGLGAAALLASLSLNGTAFAASTDSANAGAEQAKTYQTQLEQHKNLQAYTNPLSVKTLTTTKGVLPDATSGISNWSTVPAGTVANWDKTPEINKVGTSYGTVYVTFPDGSRSRLAVYVTVKDTAVSQDSKASKKDLNSGSATSVTDQQDNASKQTTSVKKDVAKENTSKNSSEKTNKDVVVKDLGSTTVTEKNVSVVNNTKDNKKNSKKSSNPVSVAMQLPETEGKAVNPLVVIGGLLVVAIGAVAIFGKKIKNRL